MQYPPLLVAFGWTSIFASAGSTVYAFLGRGRAWALLLAAVLSAVFTMLAVSVAIVSGVIPLLQASWALPARHARDRLGYSLAAVAVWALWVTLTARHVI
ncbi:MAG: hypothetical protein QJR08_01285 [Bacillota bacterium]|nr:hypothetical protein [Bacillota bacterium]